MWWFNVRYGELPEGCWVAHRNEHASSVQLRSKIYQRL
jgi:hypothetical protein